MKKLFLIWERVEVDKLWADDKTQKCIRFHGSVTPTYAHSACALSFKRTARLSYAWAVKPLNCWGGMSSRIKKSALWIKAKKALNIQILRLASCNRALWLLKWAALKWKTLFLSAFSFIHRRNTKVLLMVAKYFLMAQHWILGNNFWTDLFHSCLNHEFLSLWGNFSVC